MSYRPHISVQYRAATPGELPDGRTVDIQEQPDSQVAVLLAPEHGSQRLADGLTQLSDHQTQHGSWRQSGFAGGRMQLPPQGLLVAVSRWERVPGRMLPADRVVVAVEEEGSCVWLIDEDECTQRLQNDKNDLLLRLAGDGLWLQTWFRRRSAPLTETDLPLLTAPSNPLLLA